MKTGALACPFVSDAVQTRFMKALIRLERGNKDNEADDRSEIDDKSVEARSDIRRENYSSIREGIDFKCKSRRVTRRTQ